MMAWESGPGEGDTGQQDGDKRGVFARLYDSFGAPLTSEFQVSS